MFLSCDFCAGSSTRHIARVKPLNRIEGVAAAVAEVRGLIKVSTKATRKKNIQPFQKSSSLIVSCPAGLGTLVE